MSTVTRNQTALLTVDEYERMVEDGTIGDSSVLLGRKHEWIREVADRCVTRHRRIPPCKLRSPAVRSTSEPLVAYRHDIVSSILQHPSTVLTQVFIELDEHGSFPDLHISLS